MSTLDHTTQGHERALNAALAELDARHFGGRLIAAGWHVRVARLAPLHYGSAERDTRSINIAAHSLRDTAETRRTLIHELIHAWLYLSGDPSHKAHNESHGAAFAAEVARIAAAGEDMSGQEQCITCGHASPEQLDAAASAFLARQRRAEHPRGSFDAGGRWYPSRDEHRPCCGAMRSPSRSYPYSLMTHCRTIAHVSRLHGVDTVALRAAVRAKRHESGSTVTGGSLVNGDRNA